MVQTGVRGLESLPREPQFRDPVVSSVLAWSLEAVDPQCCASMRLVTRQSEAQDSLSGFLAIWHSHPKTGDNEACSPLPGMQCHPVLSALQLVLKGSSQLLECVQ